MIGGELVTNAADVDQVARAEEKVRAGVTDDLTDLRWVLSTPQGRRFLWGELTRHHIYRTITIDGSMIYALSGRRDAGLELLAKIHAADEAQFLLMQQEASARAHQAALENAALRIDPTS